MIVATGCVHERTIRVVPPTRYAPTRVVRCRTDQLGNEPGTAILWQSYSPLAIRLAPLIAEQYRRRLMRV